jgi:HEAT repeat protein
LKDATPAQLVAALKDDNMFWRLHAQRLLVERGKPDVLRDLLELVKKPAVDDIGLNTSAIHALWTLHGLGALDRAQNAAVTAVAQATRHKSPGVRRNAVAVLPLTNDAHRTLVEARLDPQEDPHVRLAALLALADAPPSAGSGPRVLDCLVQNLASRDRWIMDAATAATRAAVISRCCAISSRSSRMTNNSPGLTLSPGRTRTSNTVANTWLATSAFRLG